MATKRKDGRLQGSVVLVNPVTGKSKRFFFYGFTEKELQEKRDELITAHRRHFISGAVGFREFCEDFLKAKREEDKLEETTLASYRRQLKKHILPNLKDGIELAEITPIMVKHVLSTIAGGNTKQFVYGLMASIFKEAVFRGVLDKNPCDCVRRPKHSPKIAEIITPEIYQQLMAEVSSTMWERLFKFAWATGLRRGEICALRWTDIDFKAATVKVERQMKTANGKDYEGRTKTEYSIRTIALDDATITVLKQWLRELSAKLAEKNLPLDLGGYVWRSIIDVGEHLKPIDITYKFDSLKKTLHLPSAVRFHSFRHTHASLLAAANLPPKKIQARLGHADAAFTLNRYVHKTAAINDGVAEVISKISEPYDVKMM